MFYFSRHLLFKRPETDRTDGFYIEAFATIMFVVRYPRCYLILGLFSRHKNKRRVDLLYNYVDRGMSPCHTCIVGVVSLLRSYTDYFCFC